MCIGFLNRAKSRREKIYTRKNKKTNKYTFMKRFVRLFLSFCKYSMLSSILFNFRHLPIKQAYKLPIWLRKPHLYSVKGVIRIDAPIRPGMIRLGGFGGHMYPDNGIHITQMGG